MVYELDIRRSIIERARNTWGTALRSMAYAIKRGTGEIREEEGKGREKKTSKRNRYTINTASSFIMQSVGWRGGAHRGERARGREVRRERTTSIEHNKGKERERGNGGRTARSRAAI